MPIVTAVDMFGKEDGSNLVELVLNLRNPPKDFDLIEGPGTLQNLVKMRLKSVDTGNTDLFGYLQQRRPLEEQG